MLIRVDPESPQGLADQIASQVRGALIAGRLKAGERLPAARELAAGLDVNMHTVLRAYSMLRDEGLIELRRGRGAQVRADVNVGRAALDDQIRVVVQSASRLGMSRDQLVKQISEVMA
jgi:DNA-binding transcriptional regulator YhcF (GntR family)